MKPRRVQGGARGGPEHREHSQDETGGETGEPKEKACRKKASTIKDGSPTAGTEGENRSLPE